MQNPFVNHKLRQREAFKSEFENSFSIKVLKSFCKLLEIDTRQMEHSKEFGFELFHQEYPRFPIHLCAKRIELDLKKTVNDLPTTKLWNTYFELLEATDCEKLGLIIHTTREKFYVVHNDWDLRWAPGFTRIMHKGVDNKGIIVESLESFAISAKEHYTF